MIARTARLKAFRNPHTAGEYIVHPPANDREAAFFKELPLDILEPVVNNHPEIILNSLLSDHGHSVPGEQVIDLKFCKFPDALFECSSAAAREVL